MEIIYFTVVAIALYLAANGMLERLEGFAGRRFEHRSLLFFFILLGLALTSFGLIRRITAA